MENICKGLIIAVNVEVKSGEKKGQYETAPRASERSMDVS